MSYNKDELAERLTELSYPLINQTILILNLKECKSREKNVLKILNKISLMYLLKNHKKILSDSFMLEYLLYKPFREQNLHKNISLTILEKIYTRYIKHIVGTEIYTIEQVHRVISDTK